MSNDLELDAQARPDALRLGWRTPATEWVEASPIGNGRTGAMVFGGHTGTRLQLNDSSVWSGSPDSVGNALDALVDQGAGPDRLAYVRSAIDAGDYREAERLLYSFEGPWSQEFLPFGELLVTETSDSSDGAHYRRELDLDDALVREIRGTAGTATHRTTWASNPAGCVLVHMTSSSPFELELLLTTALRLDRTEVGTDGSGPGSASITLGIRIPADGAPLHEEQVVDPLVYGDSEPGGFDAYGSIALAVRSDGSVVADATGIRIVGAHRVLVAITTDSTGRRWWQGGAAETLTRAGRKQLIDDTRIRAEQAAAQPAQDLLAAHLRDVRPLLGASILRIGTRRAGLHQVDSDILRGGDDALAATVLSQFGRYLLVAASRPGSPPANLQGIWNDQLRPPWSSNYTININTQMNYWAAESSGLAECHLPLLDLIDKLVATGTQTASRLYGARGWVAHHNSDMWGWSLPVGAGHGNPSWAVWMMGGLWLTDHVWQRWSYSLDEHYLRDRAWPILLGAAEFALDWLVDGADGGLRTVPSTSPENLFRGADGSAESLAQSATMDVALIRSLFGRVRRAAEILDLDHPVLAEIDEAVPRLAPFAATADGRLREWGADLVEVDPDHRHMSQMIAVYPLGLIDADTTPELARAAVATLDRRGPGAMGWSWAWKIALRARLGDGETARELLREASAPFERDHQRLAPVDGSEWGGLLPNLFSTHPPFQIDGNYGFAAAVREMLLGTREGTVHLLPALPAAWSVGELLGARLPGALEVDLRWSNGRAEHVAVRRLSAASPLHIDVVLRGVRIRVELTNAETVLDLESLALVTQPAESEG